MHATPGASFAVELVGLHVGHPSPGVLSGSGRRRTIEALAAKFRPPALGVPVPTGVDIAVRHHHEVPQAGPDRVVAAGTPVLLLSADVPHVVARRLGPQRRVGASRRGLGRLEVLTGRDGSCAASRVTLPVLAHERGDDGRELGGDLARIALGARGSRTNDRRPRSGTAWRDRRASRAPAPAPRRSRTGRACLARNSIGTSIAVQVLVANALGLARRMQWIAQEHQAGRRHALGTPPSTPSARRRTCRSPTPVRPPSLVDARDLERRPPGVDRDRGAVGRSRARARCTGS